MELKAANVHHLLNEVLRRSTRFEVWLLKHVLLHLIDLGIRSDKQKLELIVLHTVERQSLRIHRYYVFFDFFDRVPEFGLLGGVDSNDVLLLLVDGLAR